MRKSDRNNTTIIIIQLIIKLHYCLLVLVCTITIGCSSCGPVTIYLPSSVSEIPKGNMVLIKHIPIINGFIIQKIDSFDIPKTYCFFPRLNQSWDYETQDIYLAPGKHTIIYRDHVIYQIWNSPQTTRITMKAGGSEYRKQVTGGQQVVGETKTVSCRMELYPGSTYTNDKLRRLCPYFNEE